MHYDNAVLIYLANLPGIRLKNLLSKAFPDTDLSFYSLIEIAEALQEAGFEELASLSYNTYDLADLNKKYGPAKVCQGLELVQELCDVHWDESLQKFTIVHDFEAVLNLQSHQIVQ